MGKKYADLVADAERSTASVKDPELRRIAFERVLDDLLSDGAGEAAGRSSRRSQSKSAKPDSRGKSGPVDHVRELIADGFFSKPKSLAEVIAELGNHGHHIPRTSLSSPLQSLCQDKKLRRQKTKALRGKKTYEYSNW